MSLHTSSFLLSHMFILIKTSPTHLILTRPTHTSQSHPHYQTLHSTLCYPTTLQPSPTTHSPTLSSLHLRANRTPTLPSPLYLTPSPYLSLSHPIQIHVLQRPRMNKTIDFSILLLHPVTLLESMMTKRLGYGKGKCGDAREITKCVNMGRT